MKIQLIIVLILNLFVIVALSGYVANSVVHTVAENSQGTWKKNWSWKQRWMKTWKPKTVYVATWAKVWSPAVTHEYVPLPPAPPNWDSSKPHH